MFALRRETGICSRITIVQSVHSSGPQPAVSGMSANSFCCYSILGCGSILCSSVAHTGRRFDHLIRGAGQGRTARRKDAASAA